jgi:threonine/homoserine/homoserine lactone efflux protein
MRRTLIEGRASGLVTGLGAATADAIYGCIAGFGLTFISSVLVAQQDWLRLIGGVFLLTLTNPMTILSFLGIFTGLGLTGTSGNYLSAGVLVLGVFIGSALWWVILSAGVSIFREKINDHGLIWVNRISGAVITGFGLYSLLSAV